MKTLNFLDFFHLWHYEGDAPSRRFFFFWRETKQMPELEISTRPEVGMGTPVREELEEEGTHRRKLAKGDAEGQSTPNSRRDQSAWNRVQGQWGKTSQDELAFLVALWKFH